MNELRKGFYALDMALFGFLMFVINHTMYVENELAYFALNCALFLRISIAILLYKREHMAIFPIAVFTAIFGVIIYVGVFYNTMLNMGAFFDAVTTTKPYTFESVIERNTSGETVMSGIIYWIWLMPIAIYAFQYVTKQILKNNYPWYYSIGGIIFKDRVGKLFLSMAVPLFVAFLLGYQMEEYLSFYALISIPLVGYYYWNCHLGRSPHWAEYIALFVGLYVFDNAQYKIDTERIVYLVVSACVIFAVCGWMLYKTRQIVVSTLAFLMAAFLLPTVSLGYNVYQGIEGARSTKYDHVGLSNSKGYMYIRRNVIKNGKKDWYVGVRNRYHTTIPCEYRFILPTKCYSPFARCVKENRDSVIRSVEYGYVLE